ncbi:hypothetical protein BGX21_000270 [Mortierella sp. AD011]|nr:hypothetical protein BGX20_000860 [Mortierella sp. AD010]KAF9401896.1 hypothetical protein BGX21_000270 [Mortierella sp. AD011]
MDASPIATTIGITEVVGALLTGASMILTTHSLTRMIFLRRTASKYNLFPIINVAQYINQFCIFFLITTAFDTISFRTALALNVVNNIAYFITKPTCMYLAYLRCSSVYPQFRKADWLHFTVIGFRAIELLMIVVVNIIQNHLCDGSVAKGTKCESLAIAWTLRDAGAPLFRFYYIVCEAIFYAKLFKTLKGMSHGKNVQLIQYRRFQTTLFTVDLILLTFMSIYRIIDIFDADLPTYVYYELFSSTLTIFNLTEFGLNIRILFHTVTDAKSTSEHSSNSPSKVEMGTFDRGQGQGAAIASSNFSNGDGYRNREFGSYRKPSDGSRYNQHNSRSPLTSFAAEAGYNSEYDLSSSTTVVPSPRCQNSKSRNIQDEEYDDVIPYNSNDLDAPLKGSSSQTFSPRVSQQEKHIISPSNFQSQAQNGFDEVTIAASSSEPSSSSSSPPLTPKDERRISNRISKPSRALISSDRSVHRRTDEIL